MTLWALRKTPARNVIGACDMNSRIQELIDQSSTMSWEVDHAVTTVDAHALAQRIVRECAHYVFSDDQDRRAMLDHFGVDE